MKYLILGAGVAGLTFANRLKIRGEDSFILLEKITKRADYAVRFLKTVHR